ncbi:MAG: sugar transferase [Culicoidibacterales bacterium]
MYMRIKNITDRVLALIFLVIALPIMILIIIAIKLESQGPIIFKQERLGESGKIFKIYKFRTMIDNAINIGQGLRTEKGDSRITKVGNILRKTSLDEIPQLINIIKGEMSFIGPRPPVPYHPYKYSDYSETQKQRFNVKPGITGLAQVKYRNSATWEKRIEEDIKYVEKVNLILDIKILFSTILTVLFGKNVYPSK